MRHQAKLIAVTVVLQLALAASAGATPVWYQERVFGGGTSGTLGGVPFSDAYIEFDFYGDTSTVIPYSLAGVTGTENLVGASTVTIHSSDGGVLTATFLPAAGIYVSVDHTNKGVGFGSSGVLPTDPTFPGQVMYPAAIYITGGTVPVGTVADYDLTQQGTLIGISQSCVDFPVTCNPPLPLATTAGDLRIDTLGYIGLFNAYLSNPTAFSRLTARGTTSGRPAKSFSVRASLTLGGASNGFDPGLEYSRIQLGAYVFTFAPGDLVAATGGGWTYSGTQDLVALSVSLVPVSANVYTLTVQGSGPLVGFSGRQTLSVTLGDDTGTTTVSQQRRHE
jgi:hypothetical protein